MQLTGGAGVDSAIEALGGDITFQNAIKVTKPGGTISNAGYHGEGEFVHIPRLDWGVGMAEKTIRTGLCPVDGYGWNVCSGWWKGAVSIQHC